MQRATSSHRPLPTGACATPVAAFIHLTSNRTHVQTGMGCSPWRAACDGLDPSSLMSLAPASLSLYSFWAHTTNQHTNVHVHTTHDISLTTPRRAAIPSPWGQTHGRPGQGRTSACHSSIRPARLLPQCAATINPATPPPDASSMIPARYSLSHRSITSFTFFRPHS